MVGEGCGAAERRARWRWGRRYLCVAAVRGSRWVDVRVDGWVDGWIVCDGGGGGMEPSQEDDEIRDMECVEESIGVWASARLGGTRDKRDNM